MLGMSGVPTRRVAMLVHPAQNFPQGVADDPHRAARTVGHDDGEELKRHEGDVGPQVRETGEGWLHFVDHN